MYFTLLCFVCLTWIVVAFIVGNAFEKHLRRQHRAKQIKQVRSEMQRQYQGWLRAVEHNKELAKEYSSK